MIGVVIVSHSAMLAEGVVELAKQVARDRVRIVAAGGSSDPANPIGTDAFRVQEAIEAAYSDQGVLVLMDLGSAVLSATTAIDFLDESRRSRVRLCSGPLVEGAVAAVSLAAAGASLDEVAAEAEQALAAKTAQLGGPDTAAFKPAAQTTGTRAEERILTLTNPLGLHARPAARLIHLVRRFDARVTVENLTARGTPVDAFSLNGILILRARRGHELLVRAQGSQAREVLAELASFVAAGCGDQDRSEPGTRETTFASEEGAASASPDGAVASADGTIEGIPASPGIAIGPLVRLRIAVAEIPHEPAQDTETEWRRLQSAIAATQEETRGLYEWARKHVGESEAGIFEAHLLLLEDPELIARVRGMIFTERRNAAWAWHSAAAVSIEQLQAIDDPYLSARAADLSDVVARVLTKIADSKETGFKINKPGIVSAYDLMPSQVEKLDPALVLGLCLESGGASAHSAILARARGIPAIVGLGTALAAVREGTGVAIDGELGKLWVMPDQDQIRSLQERRSTWLAARQSAQAEHKTRAATRDGQPISLLANLNREAQVFEALELGAEGVGVLRTEFLFLDREAAPDEEEQFACYRNIAAALGERPLVIRTLDIGGDKSVPYVDVGIESNPFLGWRGIRLTLGRRDLFETQIRAILRAGVGHPVEILLPMISTLTEFRDAKAIIDRAKESLRERGIPFLSQIPVGVMIEVPAAAAMADRFAAEAGRLSIGTNDLVQYLMAADRTNSRVAGIADHFQPAVLRIIGDVAACGRQAGVRVDICGEMAADSLAAPLLLGLGVDELSMSPRFIPEIKHAIANWTLPQAQAIAREALLADSSAAVRRLVAG